MARGEFALRFRAPFSDPAFEPAKDAISTLEEIAWQAYSEGRKAPVTRKAGPGYADPLNQTNDWMNEIYERWTAAHGVVIDEPYATSHETLDRDEALHEEARNVGRLVAHAVRELRAGRLQAARPRLPRPRPK